jgi:hypothetical protein
MKRLSAAGLIVITIPLLAGVLWHRISSPTNHPRLRTMENREWLDGYSGQTTQQLIALRAEYRIDSLIVAFEQAIYQKLASEGESSISQGERRILAVEAIEREVNNGGYSQFFVNSSHKFAPVIVDSLRKINCPQTAEITQKAIDALGLSDLSASQIETVMERRSGTRSGTRSLRSFVLRRV